MQTRGAGPLEEDAMEVQDMKNYGKAVSASQSRLPEDAEREITKKQRQIISKHLGLLDLIRFKLLCLKERKRMSKQELSRGREKGLTDERFIRSQITWAATFSALSKILGSDRAVEVLDEVVEMKAPIVTVHSSPPLEEFQAFEDPFRAFKEYYTATVEANNRAGCHQMEVVHETNDAIQIDVTYCAWHEIARELGVEKACLPHCYWDDVIFPEAVKPLGLRYKRTNTIAKGGTRCDFLFERIKGSE
jgi:hypothetical protein